MSACDRCLRRSWLLGHLAGHLERAPRARHALRDVMALDDATFIAALAGRHAADVRSRYAAFDPDAARVAVGQAGLRTVCRHGTGYPPRLHDDPSTPTALFVRDAQDALGRLAGHSPADRAGDAPAPPAAVAIVGARRAGAQALEVARGLGRALSGAGVTVVSGLALGVDAAAHEGALTAGGRTIAVLATGADRIYPRSKGRLGEEVVRHGAIVSEMPPGTQPYRWAFPARNRLIAALAQVTLVVEAAERSGSLITADFAAQLGREVAAVPGAATNPFARGTNLLIRDGAQMILEPADVLDALLGSASGADRDAVPVVREPVPDPLSPLLRRVRDGVAAGRGTAAALADDPGELVDVLAALTELELLGEVRRGLTGAYVAVVR